MNTHPVIAIGKEALGACLKHPDLEPVAYMNPFPLPEWMPSCNEGQIAPEVPEFTSLREALSQIKPEAAVISPPNFAKNDIALELALLDAGIPILCTKLRLADWRDADNLMEKSVETATSYFVGEHYHLNPAIQRAAELVPSLGAVLSIRYRFSVPGSNDASPWMKSYREVIIEDLCYHHFAVLEFLVGLEISGCTVSSRAQPPFEKHKNRVDILAELSGGAVLNYSGWWGGSSRSDAWIGSIDIDGCDGCLQISGNQLWQNGEIVVFDESASGTPFLIRAIEALWQHKHSSEKLLLLDNFLPVTHSIQRCLEGLEAHRTQL